MLSISQIEALPDILNIIENKVKEHNAKFILPNFYATKVRFSLYQNDIDFVNNWFYENKLSELSNIYSLNRYQTLIKARVFILKEKYYQALIMLSNWEKYFIGYDRTYNLLECYVLKAMALEEIDETHALEVLDKAISIAYEYKFVRVFADECGRMYSLLKKYHSAGMVKNNKFFKKVLDDTKKMAISYPRYLYMPIKIKEKLTKSEMNVLMLLDQNLSNNEIAEYLFISLNTVKTHTKSIYTKLNVKSRTMAVKVAKENQLI